MGVKNIKKIFFLNEKTLCFAYGNLKKHFFKNKKKHFVLHMVEKILKISY